MASRSGKPPQKKHNTADSVAYLKRKRLELYEIIPTIALGHFKVAH